MSVPTNNPMAAGDAATSTVSREIFHIAGILTTVYGLADLAPEVRDVACLWLLHPRLQTQESMAPFAASMISEWNGQAGSKSRKGLIAVTFDQRNHGSREVDPMGNQAWRDGNKRHAMDMFSIYHGTALDTSLLLNYLPSYIFPDGSRAITQNLCLGVSLGGHAVWHCILQDDRFTTAVAVIGCPDYTAMMADRATKSKLAAVGNNFIGSPDFPDSLKAAVHQFDPAGLMLRSSTTATDLNFEDVNEAREGALRAQTRQRLNGKRIMCLSGGADKLVPYACGEPFLRHLKQAIQTDGGVLLEDIVFAGVGHAFPSQMQREARRFIAESLVGTEGGAGADAMRSGVKESKL